jgi:hypothetical protein
MAFRKTGDAQSQGTIQIPQETGSGSQGQEKVAELFRSLTREDLEKAREHLDSLGLDGRPLKK